MLGQKTLNLAHRHAARVHGDDLVVEAGEAPFVLGDQERFEVPLSVARHVDSQRAVFRQYGLAADAVAVVAAAFRLVAAGRITQMMTELGA